MSRFHSLAALALALGAGSFSPAEDPAPAADPAPEARSILGDPNWRHGGFVTALAFAPDGKTLASASNDIPIRLWDSATGKQRRQFAGPEGRVLRLGFSRDGKTLFSAGSQGVRLWEVSSGHLRATVGDASEWMMPIACSPDGKTAASRQTGNDFRIRLSGVPDGQVLRLLEGHTKSVWAVAFSRDDKTLASSSLDGTVRLWDVASGKEIAKWTGHDRGADVLCFSPDGKHLATCGFGSLRVWGVASGKTVATRAAFLNSWQGMEFSPDGKTIAVGGRGVLLWDWSADKVVRRLQPQENIATVTFSPDGKTLATGPTEGPIRLWTTATGEEAGGKSRGHRLPVTALAFLADGSTLATGSPDGTVRFWDPATRGELRRIDGLTRSPTPVVFSPDGRLAAATQADGRAGVWDTATAKLLWLLPGADRRPGPPVMAFTADGKRLAASGPDNSIRMFDFAARKEVERVAGSKTDVRCLQFSPDGRYRAAFGYEVHTPWLSLADASAGGATRRITASRLHFSALAFSPDGRMMAGSAGAGVAKFIVLETATGQMRLAWSPRANGVAVVSFSPEGRYVALGGTEKALAVRDLTSGAEVARFDQPCEVTSLAWRPDGKTLAVGGADTLVRVYERAELIPDRKVVPDGELTAEVLNTLWSDLGDPDGVKSFAAMRTLSIHAAQALALFEQRVRPPAPGDRIEKLIEELDSDVFATRERASELLAKRLSAAEGALRKALEGKISAERRRRIRALLRGVEHGGKAAKVPADPQLQASRAVEVLERLATPGARRLLRAWADAKPATAASAQSKESLRRLERVTGGKGVGGKDLP
jgi:WD40 repeat protein